jgi:phosphosulfolactate synthase (CoM biosynthesis protein A)
MAAISVAGDTSGSVTLQAPAVAGSTVLTLPATSGTVMVNGPAFSAYANADLSITSAIVTKVNINTVIFDTASCFSVANNRFTPTVAGYYQVNGCVRVSATNLVNALVEIYKNGSLYMQGGTLNIAAISSAQMMVINTMVFLNGSTDYLELWGSATGTSPLFSYLSVTSTSTFSAALVRSA